MISNPYQILGVKPNATLQEIKYAYRELVKQHHPDAGGDKQTIIDLNAAWEILSDIDNRQAFDVAKKVDYSLIKENKIRTERNRQASNYVQSVKNKGVEEENELSEWLKFVFTPIDKSLGQIINIFPSKLRDLSADPYDDTLMECFCEYLEGSQSKISKIHELYQSLQAPESAKEIALDLYHCFSQVEDALNELELYTKGYVDNYLHDGNEMLREAKRKRKLFKEKRRNLPLS
tara:strand:- start:436 stop:1134 length:699 start_codon:yes stop_codon:yes gene_type:complete